MRMSHMDVYPYMVTITKRGVNKRVLCGKFLRIQGFACFRNQAYTSEQFASNVTYMFCPCFFFCYLYKHINCSYRSLHLCRFDNLSNMDGCLSYCEHQKWVLMWKFIPFKPIWYIIHVSIWWRRHAEDHQSVWTSFHGDQKRRHVSN